MPLPATERTLQAILRYTVDPRGVRDVKQSTDELDEQLSKLQSAFYDLVQPIQEIGQIAGQFEAVAFEFREYGNQITTSMRGFSEEYISSADRANDISKEWMATTESLAQSHERFGRVSAQSILPMLKLQAQVVDLASKFAEQYPEIAQVAFGIGTAIMLATSLSTAVTKGIRLIADAKVVALEAQRVIAAKLMRDAANKQLAAGAMMKKAADQQVVSDLRGKFMERGSILGRAKGAIGGAAGQIGGLVGGIGLGGFAAITAGVAALVGTGLLIKKWSDDGKKSIEEMGDKWEQFFTKTTKSTDSAVEVLDEYRAAQQRVSDAHDKGGVLADVFLNKQKLMYANLGTLSKALIEGSRSYEDYEQAVRRFNDTLGEGERPLMRVSEETYNYRRELEDIRRELKAGTASLREYGKAMVENGNVIEKIIGQTYVALQTLREEQVLQELLDDWIEYQNQRAEIIDTGNQERIDAWSEFKDQWYQLEEETGESRTQALEEYSMAVTQLELDTASERERIARDSGIDLARIERDIGDQRADAIESYHREATEAEEEYYKQRAERARDFGIETARMEEDHQKTIRRMRVDSEVRQKSAINARDALALLEERRNYERDRRRTEEDYRTDMARRSEDFARELAQSEEAFKEQQAARERAFQEQLAALQEQLREQQATREQAAKEELDTLEDGRTQQLRGLYDQKEEELETIEEENDKQKKELKDGLNKRLEESRKAQRKALLDARNNFDKRRQEAGLYNNRELTEYRRFRDDALATLRQFVTNANAELRGLSFNANTMGGFQHGGYAGMGVFRMGEAGREFVLSNPTTMAAERLMGGRLSQAGVLGAMASGGGPSVHNSFVFQGRLSEDEKEEYRAIAYEQTLKAVKDITREVK